MLDFFLQTLVMAFSIAAGIVFIYASIKLINLLLIARGPVHSRPAGGGFVEPGRVVELRLSDGRVIRGGTFMGFTDAGDAETLPPALRQWMVLESGKARVYVKPEALRAVFEDRA